MITVLLHIANSEAVKAEIEEMPSPSDATIICRNCRERNDREVTWLEEGVTEVIFPWWRINFIEILPDPDAQEDFPLFFREE